MWQLATELTDGILKYCRNIYVVLYHRFLTQFRLFQPNILALSERNFDLSLN